MKRIGALVIGSVMLALGGAAFAATSQPPLDPPTVSLPAEGLVIQRARSVELVDLDGAKVAEFPGFRVVPGLYSGYRFVLGAVAQAYPSLIVLEGPHGGGWFVDGAGVHPLDPWRVQLPGGATLAAPRSKGPERNPVMTVRDNRTGRILARSDRLAIEGDDLLVTHRVVTDLDTRELWRSRGAGRWTEGFLGNDVERDGCEPSGVEHDKVVAVCFQYRRRQESGFVRLFAVAHDGSRELLSKPFAWILGPEKSFLSPDGRYVAATLAVGCGPPNSILLPVAGGWSSHVARDPKTGLGVAAEVTGWTSDGRVAAWIKWGDCDQAPNGTYLVDPGTLRRTMIVGDAYGVLWKPPPKASSRTESR